MTAKPPHTLTSSVPATNNEHSLLSVGLPVFNGEKWVGEAIDSILQQSYRNIELIISDNASTDSTEQICHAAANADSRVRYVRNEKNIGLYQNFDRAFELGTGKYFKWAADSDFCLEGFFEKCIDVLEARSDVVLTYTQAYLLMPGPDDKEVAMEYLDDFNLEDDRPSTRFRKYLERERINNIMHGIIRRSALLKTSLHIPMPGSDISMVAELALQGKFVEIPDRLFVRRFDAETSSMLMDKKTAKMRQVKLGHTIRQRLYLHSYRFVTTARAPIEFSEKVAVWMYLVRRIFSLRQQVLLRLRRLIGRRSTV